MSVRRIEELRRLKSATRRIRDARARDARPASLARRLPALLEWLPRASPTLRSPRHFVDVVAELERVARGETIELAFSCPPRHGKSTLIVHWLVWLLMQRPDVRILYVMHSAQMAEMQTSAMRTIARRVGLELGEKQTKREWTTAGGGSVKACGIKAPPMGDGFDVIVTDDPYSKRKAAESPVERATIETAYRDDIITRELPRGTSHVLVCTRWHVDDLIGVMTRRAGEEDGGEGAADPYRLINLPALDAQDEALAPWLWSAEQLKRKRARRTAYSWASLFQGEPVPRGGAEMGAATWALEVPTEVMYAGGLDLARTSGDRSDHFASVVGAREPGSDIVYIVDIEHAREPHTDRVDPDTGEIEHGFIRRVHRQQVEYGECTFRMYTGRDEQNTLDLYATHEEFPVFIVGEAARVSKRARAEAFIAAWNRGDIRIVRGAKNGDALARQAKLFTGLKGNDDDLIDAAVAMFDELMASVPSEKSKRAAPAPSMTRRARRMLPRAARAM